MKRPHRPAFSLLFVLFERAPFGHSPLLPSYYAKALDGPTPEKMSSNLGENGEEMMEEPPSKWSVMYHKTVGRFVSFKVLLTVVTALWLWQSFLWGGMYTGCGLVVAVSVAMMAGLVIRDYLVEGSIVSRSVYSFGGLGGRNGVMMVN